jgi:hypothetical protein
MAKDDNSANTEDRLSEPALSQKSTTPARVDVTLSRNRQFLDSPVPFDYDGKL